MLEGGSEQKQSEETNVILRIESKKIAYSIFYLGKQLF